MSEVLPATENDLKVILGWLEREYEEDEEGFWSNRCMITRSFREDRDLWMIRKDCEAVAFQVGVYGTDIACVRQRDHVPKRAARCLPARVPPRARALREPHIGPRLRRASGQPRSRRSGPGRRPPEPAAQGSGRRLPAGARRSLPRPWAAAVGLRIRLRQVHRRCRAITSAPQLMLTAEQRCPTRGGRAVRSRRRKNAPPMVPCLFWRGAGDVRRGALCGGSAGGCR